MRKGITYFLLGLHLFVKAQLPDTVKVCAGDSAILDIRSLSDKRSNVYWNTPDGIITNANRLSVVREGIYKVSYFSENKSTLVKDSAYVLFIAAPRKTQRDTLICKGQNLILRTEHPELKHQWSTGAKTNSITVKSEGKYWVRLFNGVCLSTDSFRVRVKSPNKELLQRETYFCLNETKRVLSVKSLPEQKLRWSTGATNNEIMINREGWYWLQVEDAPCETFTDSTLVAFKACECEMLIPNSFTPNEDGRNDYFFAVMDCEYSYFNLVITDRWGNTVFTSYQSTARWDGRFKGNLCAEDVYVYRIESQEKGSDKKKVRTGYLSLFR